MNKLIELLNKYDEGGNWRKVHWKGLGCEDYDTIGYKDKELTCEQDEIVAYLISKTFGFIKWLVENHKIDRGKFEDEYTDRQTLKHVYIAGAKQDELIIILLAIQNSPLDFLISILK